MLGRSAGTVGVVADLIPVMEVATGALGMTAVLIYSFAARDHPDLAGANIRGLCAVNGETTTAQGTVVAGIVAERRGSSASAMCIGCTLSVRPIFLETGSNTAEMPSAAPNEVAECVDANARVINHSAAVASSSPSKEKKLEQTLSYAARRDAIVVAAAGNQYTIGSSAIARHVWVIPVAACDLRGQTIGGSNLATSINRCGLRAAGDQIASLWTGADSATSGGTGAMAPSTLE